MKYEADEEIHESEAALLNATAGHHMDMHGLLIDWIALRLVLNTARHYGVHGDLGGLIERYDKGDLFNEISPTLRSEGEKQWQFWWHEWPEDAWPQNRYYDFVPKKPNA